MIAAIGRDTPQQEAITPIREVIGLREDEYGDAGEIDRAHVLPVSVAGWRLYVAGAASERSEGSDAVPTARRQDRAGAQLLPPRAGGHRSAESRRGAALQHGGARAPSAPASTGADRRAERHRGAESRRRQRRLEHLPRRPPGAAARARRDSDTRRRSPHARADARHRRR